MAEKSRKFQAPKGMRDFYPADMAVRRHIESVWRQVSINHGFEEVEGPTFENLDLYTHKSGPGIVSEIFSVYSGKDEKQREAIRAGGEAPFALRPEFTPTLARMVAARATELPKPIKWFSIPTMFRAERPQRGRLREHVQWNLDFAGESSGVADAELMATAISALRAFGLDRGDVWVQISHRRTITDLIDIYFDIGDERVDAVLQLLDRRSKVPDELFKHYAAELGISSEQIANFDKHCATLIPLSSYHRPELPVAPGADVPDWTDLVELSDRLLKLDPTLTTWCVIDLSIVRGLAYYTGTVFEIIAKGKRAIAGGGRYDNLIESFGGPPMPACGFGMGDVVLSILLHEKGLLPEEVYMHDLRPHAFVISNGEENAEAEQPRLVAELRRAGYHVRHTYRSTRNVGKLLGEAGKQRARTAIILDNKLEENLVSIKDLESGEQREVPRDQIDSALREILAHHHDAHV